MKVWVTVYEYKGYKIEVLNGAGINDPMNYRTNPPLPGQDHDCNCLACTFSTIGNAIEAIDKLN